MNRVVATLANGKRIIEVEPEHIGEERIIWKVDVHVTKGRHSHKVRLFTVFPEEITKDKQLDVRIRNHTIGSSKPFSNGGYKITKVDKVDAMGMSRPIY